MCEEQQGDLRCSRSEGDLTSRELRGLSMEACRGAAGLEFLLDKVGAPGVILSREMTCFRRIILEKNTYYLYIHHNV